MSYIKLFRSKLAIVGIFVALVAFTFVSANYFQLGTALAADDASEINQSESIEGDPQAQTSDPEANLPFLFAVYLVTWAAFFVYIFYLSRKQREMRGEIEALKRAVADRDGKSTQSASPASAQTGPVGDN